MDTTEARRLLELTGYAVLDTPPEPSFDALTRAASTVTGCPTALVSLLDDQRQWFKSRCGLDVTETSRDLAFCDYVLRADAPLVVPDATKDPRFATNELVTGELGLRFYAGFPLRTPTGAVLGSLCVLDYVPRPEGLDEDQVSLMTTLADQVMTLLELRRALATRDEAVQALNASRQRYQALFESNSIGQVEMSPDGTLVGANAAFAALVGVESPADLLGRQPASATVPEDREAQRLALETALQQPGTVLRTERRVQRPDGAVVEIEGTLTAVAGADGAVAMLIGTAFDVTERNVAARRLGELSADLERAHDEAVERTALLTTVLDTVDVGIVACDAQGRLTLFNRATREFHGLDADSVMDPADFADRYALFEEDGTTPLAADQVPLSRALREGAVHDVDLVIAPPGLPARLVRCSGRVLRDADGTVRGAVVAMADVTASRADARALAEQAEFTAVLLEGSHAVMWACDTTGTPTYVNATGRRLLGWPLGTPVAELAASGELDRLSASLRTFYPDGRDMPAAEHPVVRALTEGDVGDVEVRVSPVGEPTRTLLMEASAFHDADGRVRGALATGYDITELRASEQRFRAAFRDGPTPTARLDATGSVQEVNAALRRFLSVRSSELVGRDLARHAHPDDRPALLAALLGPGTGTEPAEIRFVGAGGSAVWCEVAVSRTAGADGQPIVIAQLLDVDSRKAQEHVLERAAQMDGLTGLSNRNHLLAALDEALRAPSRGPVGVLFLDLDGFKVVNDAHGHDAGDAVLQEVAQRLLASVRPRDVVARLGGDEFVVLCPLPDERHGVADLDLLARRLEDALLPPIRHRGLLLHVAGSVGVAVADHDSPPGELLEAADQAMYRRKRARVATPAV
ncbi:MAG: PAS domain S-box protein [Mycobacteriales bacterium]|nr:PAS domain S-box protein [Mycobacteriales bacterium]